MKNMKKQILLRSAIGFPIGVCISSLIILVISFCIGTYAPCSPGCTALFGSETAGATAQFLLSGWWVLFLPAVPSSGKWNRGVYSVPPPPISAWLRPCSGSSHCCWAGVI